MQSLIGYRGCDRFHLVFPSSFHLVDGGKERIEIWVFIFINQRLPYNNCTPFIVVGILFDLLLSKLFAHNRRPLSLSDKPNSKAGRLTYHNRGKVCISHDRIDFNRTFAPK